MRLRTTALPIFFVTVKPNRGGSDRSVGFGFFGEAHCVGRDPPRGGLQSESLAVKALARGGADKIGAALQTMRRRMGAENQTKIVRLSFLAHDLLRDAGQAVAPTVSAVRLRRTASCGRAPAGPL